MYLLKCLFKAREHPYYTSWSWDTRGWKIHSMLCKKCLSAGHGPVLIRWFLSSLSGDQFTVNHKTHPMKKVPGIWNWVPLGSFCLCTNLLTWQFSGTWRYKLESLWHTEETNASLLLLLVFKNFIFQNTNTSTSGQQWKHTRHLQHLQLRPTLPITNKTASFTARRK